MNEKTKNFIQDNWFKIILLIIAGGLVFSYGFGKYTAWDKQKAQMLLEQQKQENDLRLEEEKERKEVAKERLDKILLDSCIDRAEDKYWEYMELNGTKNEETGVIKAETRFWDSAEKTKNEDVDNCFKKYPQK